LQCIGLAASSHASALTEQPDCDALALTIGEWGREFQLDDPEVLASTSSAAFDAKKAFCAIRDREALADRQSAGPPPGAGSHPVRG